MAQVQVTMPKMGESITEGTVIVWHKQPGDAIELDETLLEIGTDKVDTEVPSPAAGTLVEILVQEGDTVEVDTAIAVIETDADAVDLSGGGSSEVQPGAQESEPEVEVQAPEPEHAHGDVEAENLAQAMSGTAIHDAPADSAATGEVQDVVMPKMGESITEGTVIVWHKQPGDAIELDETLLEIGTDKVDTEVPSPAAGTLVEILVQEGDTVEVGSVIARIGVGEGASTRAACRRFSGPVHRSRSGRSAQSTRRRPVGSGLRADLGPDRRHRRQVARSRARRTTDASSRRSSARLPRKKGCRWKSSAAFQEADAKDASARTT